MDAFINFLNQNSPSGCEIGTRDWLYHNTKRYKGIELTKDVNGNIYGVINKKNDKFKVMIEGHIDEIGGQITNIDDNGFIFFREVGGLDIKSLPSQRVLFLNGIEGVIGKKAIHLETDEEQEQVLKIKDMYIDCGFKNKEEALQYLEIGDWFTFKPNVALLQNFLICSKGIDDKVGAYIAFEVLKKLNENKKFKTCVCAVGTTQEEITSSGAITAANVINPDVCITIDVNFASDVPNDDKNRLGDISLGNGMIVSRNADTNPILYQLLKEVSSNRYIPFQVTADTSASGGTNAVFIRVRNKGVATLNVGIPCRYMHTSGEVISFHDVQSAIELLVDFITSIRPDMSLIPE